MAKDTTMALSRMPISSDPERMSGKVCIGETRMPVAELLIHLTQGGSIHTFCERYGGMKVDELKDVLKFATHDLGHDRGAVDRARAWVASSGDGRQRDAVQEIALT